MPRKEDRMRRIVLLMACCVPLALAFGCATESPPSAVPAGTMAAKVDLRVHAGGHFSDPNLVGQDCSTTAWLDENARERWTGLRLARNSEAPNSSKTKPGRSR